MNALFAVVFTSILLATFCKEVAKDPSRKGFVALLLIATLLLYPTFTITLVLTLNRFFPQ